MPDRKRSSRSPGDEEDADATKAAPAWIPGKGWTTAPAWTRDPDDPRNQAARQLEGCAQRWENLGAARDGDGPERQAVRVLRALVGALVTGDAAALARLNGAATWGWGRRGEWEANLAFPGAPGGVTTTHDPYPPKGSQRTPERLGNIVYTINHYIRPPDPLRPGKRLPVVRSPAVARVVGEFLHHAAAHPGETRVLSETIRRHGGDPDALPAEDAVAAVTRYLERTQRPTAEGVLRCFVRLCGVSAKAATDILAVVE